VGEKVPEGWLRGCPAKPPIIIAKWSQTRNWLNLPGEAGFLRNPLISVFIRVHPWFNCGFQVYVKLPKVPETVRVLGGLRFYFRFRFSTFHFLEVSLLAVQSAVLLIPVF
jgi:hypothetical protein